MKVNLILITSIRQWGFLPMNTLYTQSHWWIQIYTRYATKWLSFDEVIVFRSVGIWGRIYCTKQHKRLLSHTIVHLLLTINICTLLNEFTWLRTPYHFWYANMCRNILLLHDCFRYLHQSSTSVFTTPAATYKPNSTSPALLLGELYCLCIVLIPPELQNSLRINIIDA